MTCDEGRLAAFLNGQLSASEEEAFDEHLLGCETCWQAVQADGAGRRALDMLRMPAPPGLADRVASSIRLADPPGRLRVRPSGRHRFGHDRRSRVAAAAAVLVLIAGALGWVLARSPRADPPQIARVVAMMPSGVADEPALRAGERFHFGGQAVTVRSYRIEAETVLVATSGKPFPMPASSHVVAGSSPSAWMASEGRIAMYGVNRPADGKTASMFLVATVPMARLPQVAARLHLI